MKKIIKNPFIFGKVVTGKDFINRFQERQEIATEIENSMNIVLYAPRRFGKTSLIMQVFNDLSKKHNNFCGMVVDFYQVSTKEIFLSLLANEYATKSGYSLEKILTSLKNTIKGISPGISFDESGKPNIEIDVKPVESKQSVEEILNLPKKLADSGKLVCVFFDEFQEAVALNGKNFQKELRSIIQHHHNVSYIFTGSKFHLINSMFNHSNSPLYNIGKSIKLDKIESDKYLKAISSRFKKINPRVNKALVENVYESAGGVPYYVQMISHEIYNLLLINEYYDDSELLKEAIKNIIHSKSDEFLILYDNLSASAKKVLHIICKQNGKKLFGKEIVLKYQIPVPTIQKAVKVLLEKAIIYRENGNYGIQDKFFEQWLKRMP
jgi:AAA+ ATPase superfamily predicted ATPase